MSRIGLVAEKFDCEGDSVAHGCADRVCWTGCLPRMNTTKSPTALSCCDPKGSQDELYKLEN